jgi:hypothetical protein
MGPIVYIETTIPSFYCEVRTDAVSAARRIWTQQWWDDCRLNYTLVTSEAVIEELERGDYPTKPRTLPLLADIALLRIDSGIIDIVDEYIRRAMMPDDPAGDALHLALASFYKCDFLLTWNCRHLANANKFERIEKVNGLLGLSTPRIVTPLELLGDIDET